MLHTLSNTDRFTVADTLIRPVALLFKEELIVWSNVGNRLYLAPQ